MKMQSFLFRISVIFLLGNSSLFLLNPGKVFANSNISDIILSDIISDRDNQVVPQEKKKTDQRNCSDCPTPVATAGGEQLLPLLTGDPTSKSLFGDPSLNPLIKALGEGGAGELSAWKLAESLLGLLRGGRVNLRKLSAAVAAYNALIKASNDEFLLNPPAELVAIRAVLAELVSAAEAESRSPK